jgi:glycosyltransferase involved in cell wall biosynthesis
MHSKKPLRIFIDGYLLNKEPQGTQTYIRELYKEIAKANINDTFYLGIFHDEKIITQFSKYKNIRFIFFKYNSRLLRMIYEIPKLIKKNAFDFAHFQYVIPLVKNKKCKYIVTVHDILFNEFPSHFSFLYRVKRNFLFRYSVIKSDFLITVSNYSKRSLIKQYKRINKEILITPNGVNKKYLETYNKEDAIKYINQKYKIEKYILYISRIEPRKNQELLIKTFLKLKLFKQNYHLVLIGKNSIRNIEFENILKSLNTEQKKRIHYFEEIKQDDLMYFYRAATIFVFPSKAEGFGIPPIEAGALKVPVLCSNTTAMSDFGFFKPYFFDPNDCQGFEKILKKLINEKNEIDLDRIQKIIETKYTWKESAKTITNIFKK